MRSIRRSAPTRRPSTPPQRGSSAAERRSASAVTSDAFGTSIRTWLLGPHDYEWIVSHHSMRALHFPIRVVFAASTFLFAVCSVLLLQSPEGPRGTLEVSWSVTVLVIQMAAIALIFALPVPTTQRQAQAYFVGFAIFGDVGLTSVLVLFSPLVSAFGCSLFVLNSALCTYFVSSRWLLAHMTWSTAVVVYTGWRVYDARLFDTYATIAGQLVIIAAVCGVPVVAHVAWTLLSADARQSLRDPLTGLHNRRGIDASLEPLWRTAQKSELAIGAVVIDIDNFKRINDTYGHDVGDLVLKEMSARMLGIAGRGAVVGRTGGEEFTMLLTGPAGEIAARVATLPDDLRDATGTAPVTVSVGAAVITSAHSHDVAGAMQSALRTADGRMYDAKRSGGGRSFISTV